jgi:hypothetical protein
MITGFLTVFAQRASEPSTSGEGSGLLPRIAAGLAVFSVVAAIFSVRWLIDRRRSNALASIAKDLGMKFTVHPAQDDLPASSKLSLFQLGSSAAFRNLMAGQLGGVDVLMVDYRCKLTTARRLWDRSKTTVVVFPNAAPRLPGFTLTPRVGLKSQASVLNLRLGGYPDLKVGQQPAHPFASHYWVGASDAKAVANLFTPHAMDFFVENKNWNVEVFEHHVAVYRIDRLVKPEDCKLRLGKALHVLKAISQSR